jgi:hypothetical protein
MDKKGTPRKPMSEDDSPPHWRCLLCGKPFQSPVISRCGHMFCWSCISTHLESNSSCPICSEHVEKSNLIPIYGQAKQSACDDRPPPPKAPRVEAPQENRGAWNWTFQFFVLPFGGGIHIQRRGNRMISFLFLFLILIVWILSP